MEFALTSLFVVPVGNSLPTSGSTQNLSDGQVGFFGPDYSALTAASIAAQKYFYIAQGRSSLNLPTKKSTKISGILQNGGNNPSTNVTRFYRVNACATAANQIVDVSNFTAKCDQEIVVSIRAHSSYIDNIFQNGLTRSVVVKTPCCPCPEDPCVNVDAQALVDSIVTALNNQGVDTGNESFKLTKFFNFERVGSGASSILRIHGKTLDKYGNPCDLRAFPFEADRLWFMVHVYQAPATSADFISPERCEQLATITVQQNSNFAIGTPDEIRQLEKNYFSYLSGGTPQLFCKPGYNHNFKSYVSDGQLYDLFVIEVLDADQSASNAFSDSVNYLSRILIASPTSSSSGIQTVLAAALGAPETDNTCVTTTTTTTT